MQYLLSEAEYQELMSRKEQSIQTKKEELQRICTLAAQHIPVQPYDWVEEPKPWGCILGPADQSPPYCDECPVRGFVQTLTRSLANEVQPKKGMVQV